jgi:hypothetical protein
MLESGPGVYQRVGRFPFWESRSVTIGPDK